MKALHCVAFILVIIGGLNWLLVGLFSGFDLVTWIFSTGTIANIVYILVGLSAVYLILTHKKTCKNCESAPASVSQM